MRASVACELVTMRLTVAEALPRSRHAICGSEGGAAVQPDSARMDKETKQMFESLIPRGKMGRPEEIATVALFLASDDSISDGRESAVDGPLHPIHEARISTDIPSVVQPSALLISP